MPSQSPAASPTQKSPPEPIVIRTAAEALVEERAALGLQNGQPAALCLSGGGIRSAAFCLGVIQALNAYDLLDKFHYLSTVSGGGYTGAWLTRCIAAANGNTAAALKELQTFKPPGTAAPNAPLIPLDDQEPRQINDLRSYTNFLTPSPGPASADTWAALVIIVRNIIINWAVFVPILLAAAALPIAYTALIAAFGALPTGPLSIFLYLATAILAAFPYARALLKACLNLPSHSNKPKTWSRLLKRKIFYDGTKRRSGPGKSAKWITKHIIHPTLAWVFLVPLAVAPISHLHANGTAHLHIRAVFFRLAKPAPPPATPSPCCAPATTHPTAPQPPPCPKPSPDPATKFLLALLPIICFLVSLSQFEAADKKLRKIHPKGDLEAFAINRNAWRIASALTAFILWTGALLVQGADPLYLAIAGPLWVLAADSARVIAYVAVRRAPYFGDLDREWLARLSGAKIAIVSALTILAAAAVLLPILLIDQFTDTWAKIVLAFGVISGPAAALFGQSALTSFLPGGKPAKGKAAKKATATLNLAIAAAASIFGLLLFMLLGRLTELAATWFLPLPHCPKPPNSHFEIFISLLLLLLSLPLSYTLATRLNWRGLAEPSPGFLNVTIILAMLAALLVTAHQASVEDDLKSFAATLTATFHLLANPIIALLPAQTSAFQNAGHTLAAFAATLTATFHLLANPIIALLPAQKFAFQNTGHIPPAFAAGAAVAALSFSIAAAAAGITTIFIASFVNLNLFSLHAMYRNRLVRAFLGPARNIPPRLPDRFTGFDWRDNIRIAETIPQNPTNRRLFHVINTTLNRTSGKDTARAERKGAPFTISPLHCGSPFLHKNTQPGQIRDGAYIPTHQYAGGQRDYGPNDKQNGISLGTAMAISGAAVSPDMGYNSSPATAFLMTLFNVRLGAWLPNPGRDPNRKKPSLEDLMQTSGPANAIPTMLQELTGQSDDTGDYIYLSDGGHFDNLGLYEMLRRRVSKILVVDAGADPTYACFDLGHALDAAFIDHGIRVTFTTPIKAGNKTLYPAAAYAGIQYPATDDDPAAPGELIYLKPWRPDSLPIELQTYRKTQPQFPHTTTTDQFFTESDFEAYRHLGEVLTTNLLQATRDASHANEAPLPGLFAAAGRIAATNAKAAKNPQDPKNSPPP
jgi:hypothetical protein